jgi:conserved hypothetical protein
VYKIFGILKRPENMPFDEFKSWWLNEHAPKVKKWKGLLKYKINFCTSGSQDFDGVAEVWFEEKQAMDAVFSSEYGQIARQSATSGSSQIVVLLTEEHAVVLKLAFKHFRLLVSGFTI